MTCNQMSLIDLPAKEHRHIRRQRSLLTGVGAYLDGTGTFDCVIRDLSDTGGRIRFSTGLAIPTAFHLVNVRDRVAYEAKVAWRKSGEAGLKWVQVVPLTGDINTRMAHLQKYLAEKSPR